MEYMQVNIMGNFLNYLHQNVIFQDTVEMQRKNMIPNDCCDNCNKNNKDNQMTPEKLEDFNKQNRKINNQPFDLVGKGHGYNTRPTFYNKEEATKSNNESSLFMDDVNQGFKRSNSKEVRRNLFTCLPTNKGPKWGGSETNIDNMTAQFYSTITKKHYKPLVQHGHNSIGANCNSQDMGKDLILEDKMNKRHESRLKGVRYRLTDNGTLQKAVCDSKKY